MGGTRRIITILVAVAGTLGGVAAASPAALADTGTEGFSYSPLTDSPTGSKPQSKLWYADGQWWATLYNAGAGQHRIYRLNRATQAWQDTGTPIDTRAATRADVLFDRSTNKLYVASHVWSSASGGSTSAANGAKLWRYTFDPATDRYTLDGGYPAQINSATAEALTIDRDSTGTLWATWTQGSRVFVARTSGDNDAAWAAPYVIPGTPTLTTDDISSVIAFGGRIGVMYDNENDQRTTFAIHQDGAGDGAWTLQNVPTGWNSDDHINLKADAGGRVFAVTKTSDTAGSEPLILLNVRSAAGTWTTHVVSRYTDDHTRPIVQLDELRGEVHVVMTCGNTGGYICMKTASMDSPSFAAGTGRAIIRDDSSPEMNDASSTKQGVNAGTGLVVLANNPATNRYWHADLTLPGVPPAPVAAAFSSRVGADGLTVAFSDASSGVPTSWRWDFGDGTGSTERNPSHRYAAAGTYTVRLIASNATGNGTSTATVTVAGAPAGGGGGGGGGDGGGGGGGALEERQSSRRYVVSLRVQRLRRGRVRLTGTVAPRLTGVRATLQVRTRRGRWVFVKRGTLRRLSTTRSRVSIVLSRVPRTASYRILIPARGSRAQATSRSLRVRASRR